MPWRSVHCYQIHRKRSTDMSVREPQRLREKEIEAFNASEDVARAHHRRKGRNWRASAVGDVSSWRHERTGFTVVNGSRRARGKRAFVADLRQPFVSAIVQ